MPTYDYVCGACGHLVEVIHGVHDHGPTECPNCHARAMRKAIVTPTVLYKGSGWAKKDRGASASTKAARAASGESGDASGSTSSSESGGSGSDKASDKDGSGSDKSSGADKGSGADKSSRSDRGSGSGSSSDPNSSSGASTSPSKGD